MRVVERFSIGKHGEEARNEDLVVVTDDWAAVVDGATDTSGRDYGGITGGRLVAEAVGRALEEAPQDAGPEALVGHVSRRVADAVVAAGGDLTAPNRPTAGLVAYSRNGRFVVRVGDCGLRVSGVSHIPTAGIDAITADARAALLEALIIGGADPAEILSADPGRAMIMPLLAVERRFQNHPTHPLGYGALDGNPVPGRFVERFDVPSGADLVLASDGYAEILDTLEATEAALARALAADPLCIGALRSTKGLAPGQVGFDDRSYLRITT